MSDYTIKVSKGMYAIHNQGANQRLNIPVSYMEFCHHSTTEPAYTLCRKDDALCQLKQYLRTCQENEVYSVKNDISIVENEADNILATLCPLIGGSYTQSRVLSPSMGGLFDKAVESIVESYINHLLSIVVAKPLANKATEMKRLLGLMEGKRVGFAERVKLLTWIMKRESKNCPKLEPIYISLFYSENDQSVYEWIDEIVQSTSKLKAA